MSEEPDVPPKPKPKPRALNQAQIAWVVASHNRALQYRRTYRFISRIVKGVFATLKWLAESLKWAAPLFVAMYTAWQAGALDGLVGVLITIKELYG